MGYKQIVFCFLVVSVSILLSRVLRLVFYTGTFNSWILTCLVRAIVFIFLGYFLASKLAFIRQAGYKNFNRRKYWTVLLPVIFPGLVFSQPFAAYCNDNGLGSLFLIIAIVLSATVEEIIFRSTILGFIRSRSGQYSGHSACVLSAVCFSLIHLDNLRFGGWSTITSQLVYSFYMGLVFGALFLVVNNVWLLGLTHGLINFLSSGCSAFSSAQLIFVDDSSGLSSMWMCLVMSPAVLIYWFLLFLRTNKHFN